MKSVLSFTALQLLASSAAAHPLEKFLSFSKLNDRSFPWHIGTPKSDGSAQVKRQSSLPTTWDPPSDLVTPLQEVWDHEVETYTDALGFQNYGFDQVIAGAGKINYCVRWDSSQTVSAAQREQIASAASKEYNKWISGLAGFDGWPYESVEVSVVGWAVKDESLLEGDTSGIEVYTDTDAEGIPQCAEACGRFFHQDGDYSGCEAGAERHYDNSLWLTDGFEGGTGGDWGQRVGTDYFLEAMETENIHIYLHEIGHTFALDDFYDWTPTGVDSFIMLSGSATEITEFDYWMLRDWWCNLKDRYDITGTESSGSGSGATATSSAIPSASATLPAYVPTASDPVSGSVPTATATAPGVPSATPSSAGQGQSQGLGSWGRDGWWAQGQGSEASNDQPAWWSQKWWGGRSRA